MPQGCAGLAASLPRGDVRLHRALKTWSQAWLAALVSHLSGPTAQMWNKHLGFQPCLHTSISPGSFKKTNIQPPSKIMIQGTRACNTGLQRPPRLLEGR